MLANQKSFLSLCAGLLIASLSILPSLYDDDTIVAKVGDRTITQLDLENFLSPQLAELEKQKAKIMEEGLAPLVERTLLEKEATEKSLSLNEYVQTAITSKTAPVTDQDIDLWYEENRARLQGRAKAEIAAQIRQFLQQEKTQEARSVVLGELRQKYPVEILLEPMRVSLNDTGATIKGPSDAPITIVEFSDFECPACKGFNPALTQVLDTYGDNIRVVFRQFPLRSIHPKAQKAAEASLCARDQDKFWEMHDAMFEDQRNIGPTGLKVMATNLGLNAEGFGQCLDSGQYASVVQNDVNIAAGLGISGTPAVYINGREIAPGKVPNFGQMAVVIDDELFRAGK